MTRLGRILRNFDITPALGRLAPGWRGPLLAALVALFAGSLSVFTLPALDRDESRFAQATAQMLETGDLTVIKFQDQPRFKKPVGIHWLQAASVSAFFHQSENAVVSVKNASTLPWEMPGLPLRSTSG